jgi:hypothetical protein
VISILWKRVRPAAHASVPSLTAGNAPKEILQGGFCMLWTIAIVLIILWLLGMITSVTLGGFIHILIVIAVIVLLIQIIKRKR